MHKLESGNWLWGVWILKDIIAYPWQGRLLPTTKADRYLSASEEVFGSPPMQRGPIHWQINEYLYVAGERQMTGRFYLSPGAYPKGAPALCATRRGYNIFPADNQGSILKTNFPLTSWECCHKAKRVGCCATAWGGTIRDEYQQSRDKILVVALFLI